MSRDDTTVEDIRQAIQDIRSFLKGISEEAFLDDALRFSAVTHKLMVIGEACNRLSSEYQDAHTDIPWAKIVGMRNFLIHAYDNVVLTEVWFAATVSVEDLYSKLTHQASTGQ